jgi:hypothetical protein
MTESAVVRSAGPSPDDCFAGGGDFRFFYNDRYRPILGTKHPAALGAPGADIFPEVWSVVGQMDG